MEQQETPKIIKRQLVKRKAIPESLLNDPVLNEAISGLPTKYNFEIPKTIFRIRESKAKVVALQFPEGLMVYSGGIADILHHFTNAEMIIMGDVTYGACCVDDLTARRLGAEFLVHYGHSCLVPITTTKLPMLYVFVEIKIDVKHIVDTIKFNIEKNQRIAILGTIQFTAAINAVANELKDIYPNFIIPQRKPLSRGEVLGCTSPQIEDVDIIVFIADGRFHIESCMISNPHIKCLRYNPYDQEITHEEYDYSKMMSIRRSYILKASKAKKWGIILGTLGRQGNTVVMNQIVELLKKRNKEYIILLLSEITPQKLALYSTIESWVQLACPRLSIDWGMSFDTPFLTVYESYVALGEVEWKEEYPMDWYANDGGIWGNNSKKD
ncbi:hypothetical protein WA158_004682 [Blastocystis sp. Blastoise]